MDGTNAALKAAHKHGVKRVVITSSVAAVSFFIDPIPDPITEDNWSNEQKLEEYGAKTAYLYSKTLAERAVWAYQSSMPENNRFEIVTICPGLVVGKPLLNYGFASGDVISALMSGHLGGEAA